MKPSTKLWFTILDRQTTQLKKLGGITENTPTGIGSGVSGVLGSIPPRTQAPSNPNPQIRLILENLIAHIKLGWALFQENSTLEVPPANPMDETIENILAKSRQGEELAKATMERERRIAESIELERIRNPLNDEEHKPWWAKKSKYGDFATLACKIIRKVAKEHLIAILPTQSLDDHFQTFLKLTQLKSRKRKGFSGASSHKNFTLAMAEALGTDMTLLDKRHGGLSHLLASVEDKLSKIE